MKKQVKYLGTAIREVVDFGFVDAKGRKVGVVTTLKEVEIIDAGEDATYWSEVGLPVGKAYSFAVMSARNGETYGSSAATGFAATTVEANQKIAKAVDASRKRLAKKFSK
jgi:hypothetical protein